MHALGGEADGLLAAATLPVDGDAGNRFGESRAQQGVARDVDRLVADLGDGTGDDVVDLPGSTPVCATSSRRLCASKSAGNTSCSAPLALPLPTGVRTAPTMTASRP